MTIRTIQSIREKRNSIGYAAVYVGEATGVPKCVPEKKRIRMIAKEMEEILEGAQDYLLRHMIDDDLGDEAKNAVSKAAMETAYVKNYYNEAENTVVYYPTCKDLIMHHNFIDLADKFYYREQDDFPPEYRRAINSAVRSLERKRLLEDKQSEHTYDEQDESESVSDDLLSPSMHVRLDVDMVENFAGSWREEFADDIDSDDGTVE